MSLITQARLRRTVATHALTGNLNPKVLIALGLALVYHGSLLLSGTYQRTYDAYVHIFFADHYRRAWFDHWDTRWYTGFTLTSYPPGSQQTVALVSSVLGLQSAFVLVQTCAVLWVVVGVYRFSRIWVDEEAAGNAALLTVFASSITETVHVFGQLPTMFSLGFLLNALPYVYRWLRHGEPRILLVAWAMNAATTAGHHVSTLFGAIFFVAPVIALAIVEALREPRPDEQNSHPAKVTAALLVPLVVRRLRRILPTLVRAGVYGIGLVAALVLVVLPYWLWSKADPITQVSIPHASRDSFLANPNAGLVFWLIPYGLTILVFPYVYAKGFTTRAWPLAGSIAMLMLLGTGGTTPIPKLLLRGAFDVLTLDRFTFWATISMFPLLGAFVVSLRRGRVARACREQLGILPWKLVQLGLVIAYLIISAFVANLTHFRKFQPQSIDMQPIVTFLEKDQHSRWRFLTLGFGDQMAWLSAQTTAASVDGNYHSARRLPELTTTPIERLEGAKFRGIPGIGSLQQFLAVPDKYNLKFVFSNDQFYDPLLFFSGWHRLQRLENGIVVWERSDIPPLPAVLPRKEIPLWQRLMWGTVPIGALVSAMCIVIGSTLRDRQTGNRTAFAIRGPARGLFTHSNNLLTRLWVRFDNWLRVQSLLPATDLLREPAWQPWQHWWQRIRKLAPPPAPTRTRYVRIALLILIALAATSLAAERLIASILSPRALIEQYYDDIDFRRFSDAYARLDPQTRPSYDQYLLNLSVEGGLVASYGKLDSVRSQIIQQSPDRAQAVVETVWVTALAYYPTTQTHELVRRAGRWYITLDAAKQSTPPDTFFQRRSVDWFAQGRRQVTIGPTDFGDILDRPELELLSARLVRVDGRYQLVGELLNVDTDPADLTVTAILFDKDQQELTRYNAQGALIHKLLPRERTPFRVDFEGVAGSILDQGYSVGEFRPHDYTPPNLLNPVDSVVMQAQAVVTTHDLARPLAVQGLRVEQAGDGSWSVTGELLNIGTLEATIPHVLMTLYAPDGSVAWVENVYIERAVRPQRTTPFRIPLLPAAAIETIHLQLAPPTAPASSISADYLVLPAETGYAALRLSVHAYVAGGE